MKKQKTILIERPAPWLNNPIDGNKHRKFYSNLLLAASELDLKIEVDDIPFGSDFAPRIAGKDQILLSYHSVGVSPGVWRIKESYVSPYYYFDQTGYSGWAKIAYDEDVINEVAKIDQVNADSFVENLRLNLIESNESKYNQNDEIFNLKDRYIFLPLQTIDDHVVALSRFRQVDVIKKLSYEAGARGFKLVIKRHPWCKSVEVEDAINDAIANGAIVSTASIHKIIPNATAVVTANSGVGFEALIHNVPVFTTAKCDYEMVTYKIVDIADLIKCFTSVEPNKLNNKFIYYYLNEYCMNSSEISSIKRKILLAINLRDEWVQEGSESFNSKFIHSEAVKYFSKFESQRRNSIKINDQLNIFLLNKKASDLELKKTNEALIESYDAINSKAMLISQLYDKLSSTINDIADVELNNKSNLDENSKNFTADYYQEKHDNDAKFQENNWLMPYLNVLTNLGLKSIREIGCGNGNFITEAAKSIPLAIGLDWAKSPKLENDSSIKFVHADITKVKLEQVDLNCSADVLEHLPYADLLPAVEKLHLSASGNFHVIACYDDGHSHLSIFEPHEWLFIFKKFDKNYRIIDAYIRYNNVNKVICVITNVNSN